MWREKEYVCLYFILKDSQVLASGRECSTLRRDQNGAEVEKG